MASGHGGKRPGAGRKPSAATVRTREEAERAFDEGVTPLQVMLDMLNGRREYDEALLKVATSAAPYIHPRLNAVNHSGDMKFTLEDVLERLRAE